MNRFLPNTNDSLVDYYCLPLIGLSKFSFRNNFIKALVNHQGTQIFVQVDSYCDLFKNYHYSQTLEIDDKIFVIYNIPGIYLNDVQLILLGSYSKISDKAKDTIINLSGLAYNQKQINGMYVTSKALLALNQHPSLIEFYKVVLNIKQKDEGILVGIELMDKLQEDDFIENYILQEEGV